MPELLSTGYQQLLATSGWELIAVVLAIAYLLLALRENSLCWYCALASTVIYTFLFWDVSLLMESGLNVYYMVMAVYGWYQWRRVGSGSETRNNIKIHTWPWRYHCLAWGLILLCSVISGALLSSNTSAVLPYLDSLTTWGSVVTTWMVARKVLENWLYWILIDGLSIILYVDRGLYLTSLLFVAYVIIVVFGYFSWRNTMPLKKSAEIKNVIV